MRSNDIRGWRWVDGHPEKVGGARTGNLQRALSREVLQSEDSIVGTVGFDKHLAPYAPWVVGDEYPGNMNMPQYKGSSMYQARVHTDIWWKFNEQINLNIDQAWTIFSNEFWENFSNAINTEV